ncbi:hypothetical protein PRIPAC_74757 [Pristionchus pacificus]|uniref:Uncharacterized protein n=1 Tax=Pristionchus pacificus TaxID=54126 RepID=A0A2A6CTC2_PRIPA|nr:hypothetical protein PRIPAC_74757 [Pristionchus pacificus]|eukprot:PDM81283.1 hypothetical protein PRIPAC_36286 [Pristionchus pacificus]
MVSIALVTLVVWEFDVIHRLHDYEILLPLIRQLAKVLRPSTRMVEGMMAASQEETNGADGDSHREGTESTADDASVQTASDDGLLGLACSTRFVFNRSTRCRMSKRKRSCYLCSESDIVLRKFPANSKEFAQKQWLDRLGLDGKQTREKLEIYREKIDQGVDIRWCSTHFDSTGSLPKDVSMTSKCVYGTVCLRIPKREHRTPSVPSTPVESDTDNEIEMDQGLITPLRQDPILHSSPIRFHSIEDYYEDVVTCNESLANLPKRFKTQSSITSGTTIDNGSEYVLSQGTIQESEESDMSDSEEEEMEDEERKTKYRIVGEQQLRALFRRCQECGHSIDSTVLAMSKQGSACKVEYYCDKCKKTIIWRSQERIGKGRSKVYKGNQEISIAAFITGVPIPRLNDFGKVTGIALPSERSMRRTIRDIGCPAIDRVYMEWQTYVRTMSKNVAKPEGIAISIDGQYDTPGYNASNCKVTVMDAKLKVALSAASVHKSESGIAERDWWHTQKPLRKKWWTAQKESPILAQLYCPFFNHLYYCRKKFPNKEDRPKALELVQSFLMHVQGKHTWKKSSEKFKLITKCDHSILKKRRKGEQPRPKLKFKPDRYSNERELSLVVFTIVNECEKVREDLEEGRLMRRLGMPEDYVFDEILSLENAREHSEDELDGEDEEYEEDEASERSVQL